MSDSSAHYSRLAESFRSLLAKERQQKEWVDAVVRRIGQLVCDHGVERLRAPVAQWFAEQKVRREAGNKPLQLFVTPPAAMAEKYACLAAFHDLHVDLNKISPLPFRYMRVTQIDMAAVDDEIASGKLTVSECVVLDVGTTGTYRCPGCSREDIEYMLRDVEADLRARAEGKGETDTPELDSEKQRVRVNGEWHDISDEQKCMLETLFDAGGGWVGGKQMGKRPDKTRKSMPPAVHDMIETHQCHGYRIPALLPE